MAKKIVLAYSGGLDTCVAITLAEGGTRLRRHRPAHRHGHGEGVRRPARARRRCRRREGRLARRQGRLHPLLRLPRARGRRRLPGTLPAGDGAGPPAHLEAHGRRGARGRRHGRRPRLHRQGQRPGALRRQRPGAGARPEDRRAGARVGHEDARRRDRLRGEAQHPDPGHEGKPVLDRREPVGSQHRVRRPRGPVAGAAGGHLRADALGEGRAGGAVVRRDRLRARHPGLAGRRGARRRDARQAAQLPRRRARRRARRPRRGPARRHQVARDLRGAGRDRPPGAPTRRWST